MDKYIWESERNIQDVVKDFINLTDHPNIIDRTMSNYKKFNYKYLGSEGYKFSLWFNYASRWSYNPAPIKGVIRATMCGCRIEAHKQQWYTITGSGSQIVFLAVCYFAAITAPFAGFKGSLESGIMFGVLATGILIRFLYTRNKWRTKNILLDLIDRVANAERQQYY